MITTFELKQRINKLDFELKEIFENVSIQEKSIGNQFFFKINCNGEFFNLNESNAVQRVEVRLIVHKSDLLQNSVSWSYSSDPTNENAHFVQKVSNFDKMAEDIQDVILNCRMDESYFQNLPFVLENLNEDSPEEYVDGDGEFLRKKIQSMGIDIDEVDQDEKIQLETNSFMTTRPEKKYSFYHHSDLKMGDKFILEQELNKIDGVNYVIFKEGLIEINFTPVQ
jgi:hypothetical protein